MCVCILYIYIYIHIYIYIIFKKQGNKFCYYYEHNSPQIYLKQTHKSHLINWHINPPYSCVVTMTNISQVITGRHSRKMFH